ncbi:MAG: DUF4339 domain-containing protein [Verrucomicrobiota bacterium]|nr:DUF4339 domain-containing protein [Verrucomicrobiota bacterium]
MQILINRDGQQHGPYTVEQAQAYLATGQLQPADNAWAQGQPAWQPLSALLAQLAPPPATASPPPSPGAAPMVGSACPQCQAPATTGQVICKACGFNLQTRQSTAVIRVPPHMQQPAASPQPGARPPAG